jgi:hypothetical protein
MPMVQIVKRTSAFAEVRPERFANDPRRSTFPG